MRISFLILISIVILAGCNEQENTIENPSPARTAKADTVLGKSNKDTLVTNTTKSDLNWANELIAYYVENSYSEKQLAVDHIGFIVDVTLPYLGQGLKIVNSFHS